MAPSDKWTDRNAGPVVRPYALTGGRTEQDDGRVLDLIAIVVAQDNGLAAGLLSGRESRRGPADLTPEENLILGLCQRPVTVTDVASSSALPLGVVRILLADLIRQGRVTVLPSRRPEDQPNTELLKEVLHGLRAL
jgi:Protein of unknown function (DUF742)